MSNNYDVLLSVVKIVVVSSYLKETSNTVENLKIGLLSIIYKKIIPSRLERVRILKLNAGGTILRHCDIQDKEAGIKPGKIARLHIPIITNDKVIFSSWNSDGEKVRLNMKQNSLCYLDHRKPHEVFNRSDEDRIHLVIDLYSDSALNVLISETFENTLYYKNIGAIDCP